MKRRDFLKHSALAGTTLMGLSAIVQAGVAKPAVGIQLYTLKDVINQDPKGILKQLASFGYKELETYGYSDGKLFGLSVAEFQKEARALGLRVVSGHYGMDIIRGDFERAVSDAKSMGQEYIVCPWLGTDDRGKIKSVCEDLNKAGELCNKYGIRMGYHNHDFEFIESNGEILMDTMLAELDPKLVGIEMDLYWVVRAGKDPLRYFEKYPGRFEQWHVKDMDKTDPSKNTEVGKGSIDFKAIFAKAKLSGMKHYYVEQESFTMPSIDSARQCIEGLRKIV
jgi:sugar phosphate isomerase/epimerase